jgi:hypothetical protein
MLTVSYRLGSSLALPILFLVLTCSVSVFSQSVPVNGNLYGQPIIGSTTPHDGDPEFVATSNEIYQYSNGIGHI